MKRVLALIIAALAAVLAVTVAVGTPADSAGTYRVDVIFDTAKGIIPGQNAKIAGARVGTIADVELTDDYKARIIMTIPRRFTFREDASCSIQPEGLISENFVQCDPGTPSAKELPGEGEEGTPTVPVERTLVPVSITDLFKIFQADVRQRFTVAIAAIGGGLAARGEDMNDILRRANPTLLAVRRLTRDLARQKDQINQAVKDTDAVVAKLASRKGAVQDFIVQSARVTQQTADHSSALADSIRRLPGLLDQTDVALANVDRLIVDGRPLLGKLRAAAPGVERVVDNLGPFARAGRPALRRLDTTTRIGLRTTKTAQPVVNLLKLFARDLAPVGRTLNAGLVDLRNHGFVESLSLFAYFTAAASSRYDSISHMIPAHAVLSSCSQYAMEPVAGCSAWFGPDRATGEPPARRRRARRERDRDGDGRPDATAPDTAPAPGGPGAPETPGVPQVLDPVQDLADQLPLPSTGNQTLDDLADFLLK